MTSGNSMIRGLLVDLDDTLIDDTWAMQAAARMLARSFEVPGCRTPEQAAVRWSELTRISWRRFSTGEVSFEEQRRERVRAFLCRPLSDRDADELFAHYLIEYEANWRLMPGADAFIERTSRLPRAIVSNGERRQVERKLSVLGLRDAFEVVVTPEAARAPKPHPDIFRAAISLIGLEASQCLMIGDDLDADILPARQLGMEAFHIVRGVAGKGIADVALAI